MNKMPKLTRRTFLQVSGTLAGGLMVGVTLPGLSKAASDDTAQVGFYIKIDPDNSVTLIAPYTDMGQGVSTATSMMIAEELEVDWETIKVEQMPLMMKVDEEGRLRYAHTVYQGAGGSTTVTETWVPLRQAGAQARGLLIRAGADVMGVPAGECFAENGHVIYRPTGQKISYGEVAGLAADLQPPEDPPALKDPKDFKIVHHDIPSVYLEDIVTGKTEFGIDSELPGMKYAVVARAPNFGARVISYDDSAALAIPGVLKTVTIEGATPPAYDNTILADGVAVVAETYWAALKGREALKIEWQHGPYAKENDATFTKQADEKLKAPGHVLRNDGDFDAAIGKAATVIERTYETPLVAHATMEPQNCLVRITDDGCDMILSTQTPTTAMRFAAGYLGIDPLKVNVRFPRLGGGFGRRLRADYALEALQIAKKSGETIKLIWTREDDMAYDYYRPRAKVIIKAGFDKNGNLIAWNTRMASAPNITDTEENLESYREAELWTDQFPANRVPNYKIEYNLIKSGAPRGYWRAPGHTTMAFFIQAFLDEAADELGENPLDFRLRLLGKAEVVPYEQHGGPGFDTGRMAKVLKVAAEKAGWGEKRGPGYGRGIAGHFTFGSYVAYVVDVHIDGKGNLTVEKVTGAVDCGYAVNPQGVMKQMEGGMNDALSTALRLQINLENGAALQKNFDTYEVMRIADSPKQVDITIVNSGADLKGMGEPPVPPLAPALVNAIFDATGKRVRVLPILNQLKS